MTRTYLDAGVLIVAARGQDHGARKAFAILNDSTRTFAASVFLQLEVVPKALSYQRQAEHAFYQDYFAAVRHWPESLEHVVQEAYRIAQEHGVAAMDALHVAAALAVQAEEVITTERPEKPMHRVSGIPVIALQTIGSDPQ
jgi:hypothetical protein